MADDPKPPPTLADLRREIDRIDEGMHRLLMERGDIIDTSDRDEKNRRVRLRVSPGP